MKKSEWLEWVWDTARIIMYILLFAGFIGACLLTAMEAGPDRACLREETLRYVNGGYDVETARWLAETSGVCDP